MSRPQLRKDTRVYRFRRRVPADLVAIVGRREVVFSLRTSDPKEAKRLHSEELAKLESHWLTYDAIRQTVRRMRNFQIRKLMLFLAP